MNRNKAYQDNFRHNLTLAGAGPTFFAQYQSDMLARWLNNKQASTVLDFGCSDGVMTSFIAALFPSATVHGVDTSAEHIEIARMAYPNILFDVTGTTLNFPDAHFNVIIVADTLHHIPVDQHAHTIAELMRVLKPSGVCCILEPNPYNPLTRYRFLHDPLEKTTQMIRPQNITAQLKPYGSTRTTFYHFFPHVLRALRPYENYLSWLPIGQLYACIVTRHLNKS